MEKYYVHLCGKIDSIVEVEANSKEEAENIGIQKWDECYPNEYKSYDVETYSELKEEL